MIKKITFLLFVVFATIINAQSISFTSATLTNGLIGNTIQVDYEYTIGASGYIYCAIENQQQDFGFVATIASADLNPAPAGTSVVGSFLLTIPTSTIPFYNLPNGSDGVQTVYRIKITLSDSSFNYLDGQFPGDWISLTDFSSFTGATDSDWSNASNWDVGVPNATTNATIPASQNAVISSTTGANTNDLTIDGAGSLTVDAGGSLKVAGTSTGNITYTINVSDTNWHLIASPVVGAQYDDTWITNNDIASGTDFLTNRGVSTYDNVSSTSPSIAGEAGHWRYHQGGAPAQIFETGIGYALIKDVSPGISSGNFNFTGTVPNIVNPTISQGLNNWNLVGNSFPSYLDVAAFITANGASNAAVLSDAFQAVYVFNASTGVYEDITTGYVQPGQAFFINSKVNPGTVSITQAMQSHQSGVPFYKSNNPSLKVAVSSGKITKTTQVNYLNQKTNGLDPGFDIGLFDGVSSDVKLFTELVENNNGIAFKRQALPLSEIENSIVPLGLKVAVNEEIIFSVEALNLPSETKVFLEDKVNNTFTRLDEINSTYKITLKEAVNGIGRFYLHTTQSRALSVDDNITLENTKIYKVDNATLRIVGLQSGKSAISLYNILGKKVLNTSFDALYTNNISLPKLSSGVYIIKLQTETGRLEKKIVLK